MGVQPVSSQRASAVAPADVVKAPPAKSSGPFPVPSSNTARSNRFVDNTFPNGEPAPMGAHAAPSQEARLSTSLPCACVNAPPVKSFGPLPSSKTASASARPLVPPPTADQLD